MQNLTINIAFRLLIKVVSGLDQMEGGIIKKPLKP